MSHTRLSIRVDLASGERIGPGKIALLEAIAQTGSISAAARQLGMSYRRAWLLVEDINTRLKTPAVTRAKGGMRGGSSEITDAGQQLIILYRKLEASAYSGADADMRALAALFSN
jgi:molybdate transport system regulatory protein